MESTMHLASWLLALGVLLTTAAAATNNVLLIVVDDLRPWIGAYNQSWIHSPHLDRLAATGTLFTKAYANQAVCGPSRVSFLTGRRPDSTKLYDFGSYWRDAAGNYSTMPEYFKGHGYDTRSVGKVFHPLSSMKAGGHVDDVPYSWSTTPYHPPTEQNKQAAVCNNSDIGYPSLPDDGRLHSNVVCPVTPTEQPGGNLPDIQSAAEAVRLLTEELGQSACSTISQQTSCVASSGCEWDHSLQQCKASPFFLAVGFHKPHVPLKCPKKYLDLYPLAHVPMPPESALTKPPLMPSVAWDSYDDVRSREDVAALDVPWPYGPIPADFARLMRRAYAACVSYIDDQVGKVLSALDAQGLDNSTSVVFFSDHGWQLSERGEFAKYSNAEAATHVPLIVRQPGAPPRRSNALVELVDIWPSIAELAGLPPPPLCPAGRSDSQTCVEGTSWAPHVHRGDASSKKAVFSQYPRPAESPRGPDQGNTDLPSLVNITVMGYSVRTSDPAVGEHRYTEWVGFSGNYTDGNKIVISGPEWNIVKAKELYDLAVDPLELDNLADKHNHATLVADMSRQLHLGWRNYN